MKIQLYVSVFPPPISSYVPKLAKIFYILMSLFPVIWSERYDLNISSNQDCNDVKIERQDINNPLFL